MTRIVIHYNRLGALAERLPKAVSAVVHKAAFDVEANAKATVPVDTGMLKSSITSEFPSATSAVIAPYTEYAGYVEYGTSRMRAQPYMRPAAEKVAPAFLTACARLEEQLR